MRLLTAAVLGLGMSLSLAQPAQAQSVTTYGPYTTLGGPLYNEGPGILLGDSGLVFHPGLAVDGGYDSNVYLSGNSPTGAGLFRLRLHIDLSTLPPQRLDAASRPKLEFRFSGAVEYRQYFATASNPSGNSCQSSTSPCQINGYNDIYLAIRPNDPLSLKVYNNLLFTNDSLAPQTGVGAFAQRLYERFGLLGVLRPGSGPLEIGLGSDIRLDYFLPGQGLTGLQSLDRNSSIAYDGNVYAALRVLPQTTIKLEQRFSYIDYYYSDAVLPQAAPVRTTLGVNSLILPALGVTAYIGYANSLQFSETGSGAPVQLYQGNGGDNRYNSFIGGVELRLRLAAQMKLALGWARDMSDSIFATYVADDRFYLSYDHYIWRGLVAHLHGDTYLRDYGHLIAPATLSYTGYSSPNRSDVIVNLGAELDYRVLSWLEVGVNYSLLYDNTDFAFCPASATCTSATGVPAGFTKNTILAKIDIAY